MTEFGRRSYENGSLGTDHGRAFAVLAMGNGINGGKVHGKWPGLAEDEAPVSNTVNIPWGQAASKCSSTTVPCSPKCLLKFSAIAM